MVLINDKKGRAPVPEVSVILTYGMRIMAPAGSPVQPAQPQSTRSARSRDDGCHRTRDGLNARSTAAAEGIVERRWMSLSSRGSREPAASRPRVLEAIDCEPAARDRVVEGPAAVRSGAGGAVAGHGHARKAVTGPGCRDGVVVHARAPLERNNCYGCRRGRPPDSIRRSTVPDC
jgi:hypothetical protein